VREDILVLELQFDASVLEETGELLLVPKRSPDRDVRLEALELIPRV
jgi:hypothetical protein